MADIMGLMKQAQALQGRVADIQKELETLEVEGQAGAGLVRGDADREGHAEGARGRPVAAEARRRRRFSRISSSRPMADARTKADRLSEEKMKAVTAGLPLPPGFKLPF